MPSSAPSRRSVEGSDAGIGAVFQILGEKIPSSSTIWSIRARVGGGHRLEVGVTGIVLENFHHVGGAVGAANRATYRLAETLPDVGHQAGEVEVLGIDLV